MPDENAERPSIDEIAAGEMVIEAGAGEYELLEEGVPLKTHISNVAKTMGKKFQSEEMEPKLVIDIHMDEDAGNGQVYRSWVTPNLNPKATLTKIAKAVFGEERKTLDPTELLGMPLQITLITKPRPDGTVRQYIENFMRPDKSQKKRLAPSPVSDTEIDAELEAALDGAGLNK